LVGGCAPSPEFFEIFIPKWRIFVHSANDGVAMPPLDPPLPSWLWLSVCFSGQ